LDILHNILGREGLHPYHKKVFVVYVFYLGLRNPLGEPPSKALILEVTSKLKDITLSVNNKSALSRDHVQSSPVQALPIQQGLVERNAGLQMFAPVHAAHVAHVAADRPHVVSDMTAGYQLDGTNAPHVLLSNLGSAPVYDFGTVQEGVSGRR
jgi:hypothetical protein